VALDDLEVAPLARVQRSRLAFAAAITVAALPLLVLDNLPATAETNGDRVEVLASAADESSSSQRLSTETTTLSSVIEAPATTSTSAAPETTTSTAPTTTETAVVQARQAPTPAPPTTAAPTTAAPTTAAPTTAPQPPPPAATAAPPPPSSASPGDPNDPATWDRLAECESHGNWSLNTGNGYYGGLQFSLATWQNVGGAGYPHQATKAEQIHRGKILQARAGWGQWPHCSRELGYT